MKSRRRKESLCVGIGDRENLESNCPTRKTYHWSWREGVEEGLGWTPKAAAVEQKAGDRITGGGTGS
jgi:hypothetical protein